MGCHVEAMNTVCYRGNRQGWNIDSSVQTSLKFIDEKRGCYWSQNRDLSCYNNIDPALAAKEHFCNRETSLMSNVSPPRNEEAKHTRQTDQSRV